LLPNITELKAGVTVMAWGTGITGPLLPPPPQAIISNIKNNEIRAVSSRWYVTTVSSLMVNASPLSSLQSSNSAF
jgi:hypothetical protein